MSRLLLPVLAALALVAAVDASLRAKGLPPRLNFWGKSFDDLDVIYTHALDAQRRGKRVVVFIGDSRIEWGLDPDAVQRAFNEAGRNDVEVFNLAMPGRNVRTILGRFNEVGFYPDTLVVGYSHLSFYWSKNYMTGPPHRLGWWGMDATRIRSFAQRKLLMWPYLPAAVWHFLYTGLKPEPGSWLDRIDVSPRGQARVHYLMPRDDAVKFQQTFYKTMYGVAMTEQMVSETNDSFLKDMTIQREHGTKVLLLKMPLSDWALELERANEKVGLAELSSLFKTPVLDGNDVPGATQLSSFDGLHLTPEAAAGFSETIARSFVIPNVK